MPTDNINGMNYAAYVFSQQASSVNAQEKDKQWLNSLSQGQDAMEWNGFNNELSRSHGVLKPATIYMFGPLIDAPTSQPDTILTPLTYMQQSMVDMGMDNVHLCIDM